MRIRDVSITPPLVLAPMEGVTDVTFRRLIRRVGGCGLTVTEFVAAEGLRREVRRVREMAEIDPDEHPVAIQLYGRNPEALAEGARIVQGMGADIVDLNMGCPSKKVCAHSGGSALMKEPTRAREIVAAIRAAVSIPFTVKMRSGWDAQNQNAPELAFMCQEEGVEAVAVHWRTRADRFGGVRRLDAISAVKARVSIPVIANGDIVDVESGLSTLKLTGCDGLMIGRGAVRNPWLFAELAAALDGSETVASASALARRDLLLDYFESIRGRFRSEYGALGRLKKIAGFFTNGVAFGSRLRQAVFHSQTPDAAIEVIQSFFARLDRHERGDETAFSEAA